MPLTQFRVALAVATVIFAAVLAACGSSDPGASITSTPKPSSSSNQGSPSATLAVTSSAAPGTPAGTDNGLCTATASMSLPAPATSSYTQTVAAVLSCNGVSPAGATMHAIWHEKSADKTCDATADATGAASCGRKIGTLTSGYKVVVDVTFGLNGAAYSTKTSFTPQ